jgi:hypothetical protein
MVVNHCLKQEIVMNVLLHVIKKQRVIMCVNFMCLQYV